VDDELGYMVSDLKAAGFGSKVINQVLRQQYTMLDKLKVQYKRIQHP